MIGPGLASYKEKYGFRVFLDKPSWPNAATNHENLKPANPLGL
jgi:hypothetical protein